MAYITSPTMTDAKRQARSIQRAIGQRPQIQRMGQQYVVSFDLADWLRSRLASR